MRENLKIWADFENLIPKGTQTASKSFNHIGVPPFFAKKGKKNFIFTEDGRKILDYGCALGPNILGYNNRKINSAIKKQLKKGTLFSVPTMIELELAEKLTSMFPGLEQVRFCKNGSDAVLGAVRIASSYTGRNHIARYGYNGFSDRVIVNMNERGLPPELKNYIHDFKYNDLKDLERILKAYECSCILMEPVSLEYPDPEFLARVKCLSAEYGALLIFDEVVSGFRFGLRDKRYGNYVPDLVCYGKAMANGMPLSVVGGKKEYMNELNSNTFFSMTFGGETLSIASALATIKELEKKDFSRLRDLSAYLRSELNRLFNIFKIKANAKGCEARTSLEFENETEEQFFRQEMLEQNIFMPKTIYVNFCFTEKQIEHTIKCARDVCREILNFRSNLENRVLFKNKEPIFNKK